jgi:beta-N-acetylhexosaminidase
MTINAAIFACRGPELLASEAVFFRDCNPWGFILFGRNIETPQQVSRLCADLRNAVGRDALIFVDQEGGRVQRLGQPHWRKAPCASDFGELYRRNKQDALRSIWLNFRMIAEDLREVGITANCAPVLDLPVFGADPIISDRVFSRDPEDLIEMAHACMDGLTAGGVVPVIKHIPGHGRAKVDSHKALPVITETLAELEVTDFVPFKAFADAPIAMTAHVVIDCVDAAQPITTSKPAFQEIVRGNIGFNGLVMSDDLDMKALTGGLKSLAAKTLASGCDIVLQCSGQLADMVNVAKGLKALTGDSLKRAQQAETMVDIFDPFNAVSAREEFTELMRQLEPIS